LSSSSSSDPFDGNVALGVHTVVVVVVAGVVATVVVDFVSEPSEPAQLDPIEPDSDPLDDDPLLSLGADAGVVVVCVVVEVVVDVVDEPSSPESCAAAGAATTAVTSAKASRPTGVRREQSMRRRRHICPSGHPLREISHPCQLSVTRPGFRRWG
jgi:hypothetical protein